MVGDDPHRAPARLEEAGDAADQAIQLAFDLADERGGVVMVAVLVDFARLQPAARARVQGDVQRAGVDDLIARGLHGFAEFLYAGRAAGTLHRGLERRTESVTSDLAGHWGDGRLGGGGHRRDRGPAVFDRGPGSDRLQTFGQPAAQLVAQPVHKDDAFVVAGDYSGLVTGGWERLALQGRLKGAGGVVQPGFKQVADGVGNGVLLLGGRQGEDLPGAGVREPSAVGIDLGYFAGRRAPDRRVR